MRIANIIEEGKLGGPQVRMIRVAAALKGQAETVIVMPRENAGPFQDMCRAADIDYVALPLSRITREWRVAFRYVMLFPYEIWRIRRVLKKGRFDLTHVSGGSWQYKGVIAAKLAGVKVIWHLNDTQMPRWIRSIFRMVQPLADGLVFASERSRDYYGALAGRQPDAVIPSTVDRTHFNPDTGPGDDTAIESLGDGPVIGTVANVSPVKGLECLVRATALLLPRWPDLRVAVVGPVHRNQEAYHRGLCELAASLGAAEAIHWVGARSDVRPLLARMDVYVCSSVAESSPVSVWEAAAMARPVVSTDVGDVALTLSDPEGAFIVPVGDAEAMAAEISRLLEDAGLRARTGAAARAATTVFSPDNIAARTLAFYRRIAAGG